MAVACLAVVIASVLALTLCYKPAKMDYISYWSAGQLLMHHGGPYSPAQVLAIERTQGLASHVPDIMRNPPWALFLAAPLGWGNARAGLFFIELITIGSVIFCLELLGVAPQHRLLAFCFAPVFACIGAGQSSPLLLIGFVLFLRFHRSRPFLAGTGLLLMAIKPHLFLIFWPILLIDCLYRKNFRILAGGASAFACAMLFAFRFDPHIWGHYLAMLDASHLEGEFMQTPSYALRHLIAPRTEWVQLVPSCVAVIWGCWYYVRNQRIWDWRTHGMLLILVTVLVSPYAWMTDEIVLLPSIMLALTNENKSKYSTVIFVAISGTVMAMLMMHVQLTSGAYLWTPAAWVAWYIYTQYPSAPIVTTHESTTLFKPLTQ